MVQLNVVSFWAGLLGLHVVQLVVMANKVEADQPHVLTEHQLTHNYEDAKFHVRKRY